MRPGRCLPVSLLSHGVTSTSLSDQHFPLQAPHGETPEGLQKALLQEERDIRG